MKTVYYHAIVYTGQLPLMEAFSVEDGVFDRVGTDAEAALWEADARVDLMGRFVCAGFNDSHMHVLNYGQSLTMAPLYAHTGSLQDMIACLRQHLELHPVEPGQWLTGRGWNQDYFSDADRMPNRYDLDQVSTQVPILAVRACGHAIAINSKAIEVIGLTADTPQVDGGEIVMENGQPNGVLLDNAMDYVYDKLPAPSAMMLKDMLRQAMQSLNRYGVTSAQTDDYCVFAGAGWEMVNQAYRELEEAGEMTVRIYEQSNFTSCGALREFVEAGNVTGVGSDWFRIGPLKMLGDGALGAHTAYLSIPYADAPETRGIPVFSQEVFDEMIGYANAHGMQTAVHAIGDACLDRVLNAMEKALAEHPRGDHRHGIVHCQITRPEQLERLAKLKAHIYMQSIFLDYDTKMVESRVGPERAATSYSWKSLQNMGCSVSNGTDCPVELPFALGSIQCAVTRQPLDASLPPYLPEQAFTVTEALDSYTSGSAYASFEESRKGKILPGMLADFVVLGQNPLETDIQKIKDIPVLATYVGGKRVFGL